jgi:DsbC/DsbD-like thiol-disulfide interchange protein
MMGKNLLAVMVFAVLPLASVAHAQILDEPQNKPSRSEAVQYLYPEQVTVPAQKSTKVELHFRIAPGLHINSHSPKDQYLIPTSLSLPAESGVKLDSAIYPAGADFVLPADPKTKLSVYTNEFIIDARLIVQPGDHLVQAKLHYQACDQAQCLPPRTITVPIDVIGK